MAILWPGIYSKTLDEELIRMAERQRIIDSSQWTGNNMYGPQANPVETLGVNALENRYQTDVAVLERKPLTKLEPEPVRTTNETVLKEYAVLAQQVGIAPPDLVIEEFKAFLNKHDLPVFNLQEVIAYMDEKAKQESKNQAGWCWKPLRKKDHINAMFGVPASYHSMATISPSSDHYHVSGTPIYDKIIPLHALKKIALIEKEFKHQVAFFVCDYAALPQLNPDPFLMAVINNPRLASGEGRFVVDMWLEPGFGISSQLK